MNKLLKYSIIIFYAAASNAYAGNFNIFANELVWNISEQTASLWSEDTPITTDPNPNQFSFNPKNVNFNWQKGFKGGLGYVSNNHYWNTSFAWTYFPAQTSAGHNAGAQIVFPEFFSGFISGNYFFGAQTTWQIIMNMFDLTTSHPYQVNASFTLSPSIGLKGGSIYQNINTNWNAVAYVAKEFVTQNYRGIGPSLGLAAKWNFYEHFSLVGGLSSAFMWGKWNIKDTYIRPSSLVTTATTITTSMNQSQLGTLMLDYLIGLEWRYKGKSEITLNLGYEMQYWANQLRIPTFQLLPVRGDMTIQGATCGISINL